MTGGAPVSHMFKWLPKAFRSLARAGTLAKALERPLFSTTPKGLPKSGAGTLAKVDSGNQLSTSRALGLGLGPMDGGQRIHPDAKS